MDSRSQSLNLERLPRTATLSTMSRKVDSNARSTVRRKKYAIVHYFPKIEYIGCNDSVLLGIYGQHSYHIDYVDSSVSDVFQPI